MNPIPLPGSLPDSTKDVAAIVLVAVIASLMAFFKQCKTPGGIQWIPMLGSAGTAGVVGMGCYGGLVMWRGAQTGYASVVVGAITGYFADDIIRWVGGMLKKKLDSTKIDPQANLPGDKKDEN